MKTAPLGRMLGGQVRAEFLRLLRSPEFTGFTLAFPSILYFFIGATNQGVYGGVPAKHYTLAALAAYSVVNVALFSFGVAVATDRMLHTDALLKASPVRPAVVLAAKAVAAAVFAVGSLVVLFLVAGLLLGVRLQAAEYLQLTWRLLLGMLPFLALGFAVGYLVNPGAAVALVNLIFLPMSFASGIFIPLQFLPSYIRDVAPYLPMYHYGRVAWSAVGVRYSDLGQSVLWLAAWFLALAVLAIVAQRRDELRRFA